MVKLLKLQEMLHFSSRIKILVLLCLCSTALVAQDIHWSTSNINRALINPAENGIDSSINATLIYRNQWKSLVTPFSTFALNVNSSLPKHFGIGLTAFTDKAGSAGLKRTNAMLNLNYSIKNQLFKLRAGLGLGVDQLSISNQSEIVFPDQINPDLSIGTSQEQFQNTSYTGFDNSAGLFFEIPLNNKHLLVGLTYNHFLASKHTAFLGSKDKVDNLFSSYISLPVNIDNFWSTKPFLMYQNQSNFQELIMGTNFHHFKNGNALFGGLSYRLDDALIAQVGFNKSGFKGGISYDYTISSLRANAGRTGATEIFLSYTLPYTKKKSVPLNTFITKQDSVIITKEVQNFVNIVIRDTETQQKLDSFYYSFKPNKTMHFIEGNVLIKSIKSDSVYYLEIEKRGYFPLLNTVQISFESTDTVDVFIELNKIKTNTQYTLNNIKYEYNEWNLTDESLVELNILYKILLQNLDYIVEIASHTDNKGDDDYNKELSLKRANSCVKYLISKGISSERLKAYGLGENKPIAPNNKLDGSDNPEGRALNRRTEFSLKHSRNDN
mgnify:CR=1 FL=1